MIEVIYNEENNENTVGHLHIPKNIRQIGEVEPRSGIYIEDYVCSYVGQITKREVMPPKVGILLGNNNVYEKKQYIFIDGAIDVTDDIEVRNGNYIFNDNLWSKVYEKIKKFFDNHEIVGWFLYVDNEKVQVNSDILKTHIDNFAGNNKILMLQNSSSSDVEFYLYKRGQLVKQKGYFVYYEKNEGMKEYMIYKNEENYVASHEVVADTAVRNFRSILQEKKEESHQRKMMSFMYTASTFLVIVVFVIGITMLNNYDKMKNMESVLNDISESLGSTTNKDMVDETSKDLVAKVNDENEKVAEDVVSNEVVVEKIEGEVLPEETTAQTTEDETVANQDSNIEQGAAEGAGQAAETAEIPESLETAEVPESSEVVEGANTAQPQYYTVSEGDTLLDISKKVYNTESMVSKICQVNQIDDGDKIYAGQQILLP